MNNILNNIEIIEENEENIPVNLLMLADPSRKMVSDYITRGLCYVAKLDDEIIGEYVLLKTRPGILELVNIAVAEKFQGKGIGKKLILHAVWQAKNSGAKTLELGTGNSSIKQLALYQKCGFRITGVDKDFFLKHYDEEIIENGIKCVDMIRLSLDLD